MNKFLMTAILGTIFTIVFGPLLAGGWWVAMLCFWLAESRDPDSATYHVTKDLEDN